VCTGSSDAGLLRFQRLLRDSKNSGWYFSQVSYGVATDSRIDKIIGLFSRIMSLLQGSCTKETYNLIDPTNQSHPIYGQFKKKKNE